MAIRFFGLPDEDRLELEQATGLSSEGIHLLIQKSVEQANMLAEKMYSQNMREIQEVIGPHGSITRLQAGGVKISQGEGIGVYLDGVLKTTIEPDGDLFVGSNIEEPASTSMSVFVNDQIYNNEQMGEGDILLGDNTAGVSNVKFDASEGQLQFRFGTTVNVYMDTDGSLKAGGGAVILDEEGISIPQGGDAIVFQQDGRPGYLDYGVLSQDRLGGLSVRAFTASETDILTNGDFETGSLSGWTVTQATGTITISDEGEGYGGGYAAEFNATAGADDYIEQTISASTYGYVVRFRVKGTGSQLEFFISAFGTWNSGEMVPPEDWRTYFVYVPDTGTNFKLAVTCDETVFFDDIEALPLPASPPFSAQNAEVFLANGNVQLRGNGVYIYDNTGNLFNNAHELVRMTNSSFIFNSSSDDIDAVFKSDGGANTLYVDAGNNRVGIGLSSPKTKLTVEGTTTLKEQAAADSDAAAYGQLWVRNDAPNLPMFTDDAGNDWHLKSREILTAARTYYVRTDGSDSNTGLADSSGGAFLTVQKAIDTASMLDSSIYDVTVQVRSGTFTENLVAKEMVGAGMIHITGDETTPANVVLAATSGNVFDSSNVKTTYQLTGVKFTDSGSAANAIVVSDGSYLEFGNVNFGGGFTRDIFVQQFGFALCVSNYTISGGSNTHISIADKGLFRCQAFTITLTGTPAFSSSFAGLSRNSTANLRGNTYSGSATGKRYNITSGSVLDTNNGSDTYLPGDTQGTVDATSLYLTSSEVVGLTTLDSQFDKTNTTLASITGFSATLLAARKYKFRLILFTTSNVAGGVKIDFDGGTATMTSFIAESVLKQGGALVAPGTSRSTAIATDIANVTAVTAATIEVDGTMTVNAAGTFIPRFACNAATGTSSVLVGSIFEIVKA